MHYLEKLLWQGDPDFRFPLSERILSQWCKCYLDGNQNVADQYVRGGGIGRGLLLQLRESLIEPLA